MFRKKARIVRMMNDDNQTKFITVLQFNEVDENNFFRKRKGERNF